ncbi:hypothetical protein ACOSQ3_010409 [Xanthoceras sorbifolium]
MVKRPKSTLSSKRARSEAEDERETLCEFQIYFAEYGKSQILEKLISMRIPGWRPRLFPLLNKRFDILNDVAEDVCEGERYTEGIDNSQSVREEIRVLQLHRDIKNSMRTDQASDSGDLDSSMGLDHPSDTHVLMLLALLPAIGPPQPPPHPSMCFNLDVDASYYTVKRRVGIGIVVRNDKGEAIFAATVPVSHCGAIEMAEARTVLVSRS